MGKSETVTIYLEDGLKQSAEAGTHNFINLMSDVLRQAGYTVLFSPTDAVTSHQRGNAITHMRSPPPGGLVFRRVYEYPFWSIEATSERWHRDVALLSFAPENVDADQAEAFATRWRKRLFPKVTPIDDGYIYLPLQGIFRRRRSFQKCSPLQMVEQTLMAFPDRKVIIGLHPKENYDALDHAALEEVMQRHRNVEVVVGQMKTLLPGCRAVVTQNSGAAFFGYLMHKPAALFAEIDFHHIAETDPDALHSVVDQKPDYDRYVYWFWQMHSINAGRAEATEKIRGRFQRFGWIT